MGSSESRSCPYCGGPLSPAATRCDYCGNEVQAAPPPPSPSPPQFTPPPPVVPIPSAGRRTAIPALAALGALLIAGIGAGVFFMQAPSSSSTVAVPPSSGAPPTPLALGVPTAGVFLPGLPVDAGGYPYLDYVITVVSSGSYTIDLVSGNTSGYDPYLRLLQNGTEIASDDDGGEGLNSRLSRVLQPGQYVVRVSKFGSSPVSNAAPFTLTVTPPVATTPPPTPPTPPSAASSGPLPPLPLGAPVTGLFSPGLPFDGAGYPYIDYSLTVTTPGVHTIELVSSSTTSYDPYLRLLQNGTEITHDDDGGEGQNARISIALQPGVYVVRVSKYGVGPVSQPVSFTLSATAGEAGANGAVSESMEESYRSAVCGNILTCYRENDALGSVNLTVEADVDEGGGVRTPRFRGDGPPRAVRTCIRRQLGSLTIPGYQGGRARITCRYAGTLMVGGMMMSQGSTFEPR